MKTAKIRLTLDDDPAAEPADDGSGVRDPDRYSTAERTADVLRRRITDGALTPGTRLSEEAVVGELGVSRNTLREAFRLLTHEGLLVHHLHRGVFVPQLTRADVADLFHLRRILECDVIRSLTGVGVEPDELHPLYAAVEEAELAAAQGRWMDAGTANMHFHRCLVALARSPRINAIMRRLLAELRLVFHTADAPRQLYEPYIERNRELTDLLASQEIERAADKLATYLRDSERQLTRAHRARA